MSYCVATEAEPKREEGALTSLRKYCRASSVCRASLEGQAGSSCSSISLRRPDMKDIRGQGGLKSIVTGGLSGPSAYSIGQL